MIGFLVRCGPEVRITSILAKGACTEEQRQMGLTCIFEWAPWFCLDLRTRLDSQVKMRISASFPLIAVTSSSEGTDLPVWGQVRKWKETWQGLWKAPPGLSVMEAHQEPYLPESRRSLRKKMDPLWGFNVKRQALANWIRYFSFPRMSRGLVGREEKGTSLSGDEWYCGHSASWARVSFVVWGTANFVNIQWVLKNKAHSFPFFLSFSFLV